MLQVNVEKRVSTLVDFYGDGQDGACPTAVQWGLLFGLPDDVPITLLNLCSFPREKLSKEEFINEAAGLPVIRKYGKASYNSSEIDGKNICFPVVMQGGQAGEETDWRVAVVGIFPNPDVLIRLFEDRLYQDSYRLRMEVCNKQQVLICTPISEII